MLQQLLKTNPRNKMRKNVFEDDTNESPRPIKRRSFGEDTIE